MNVRKMWYQQLSASTTQTFSQQPEQTEPSSVSSFINSQLLSEAHVFDILAHGLCQMGIQQWVGCQYK
jgi:hypothetical protein